MSNKYKLSAKMFNNIQLKEETKTRQIGSCSFVIPIS